MKRALICMVALLALAGCGKKDAAAPAAATGTATPASATAPAATTPSALPTSMPTRKAGLWEQTMKTEKMSQTMQLCLDDAVSKKMSVYGQQMGKSECQQQSITPRLTGGWSFHSVCNIGGGTGTVTSDGTATGDFGGHYDIEMTSTTAGSSMPQANGVHKMSMTADWKGPCPAGMRAGDMTLPGGMKINMADSMEGKTPDYAHMSHADMAKLRAQGEAMAASMRKQQQ